MKHKYLILLGIFALFTHAAFSQLDTKHWVPPFYAKPGPGTAGTNMKKHFVSLSTPSMDTIPVTIKNGFGDTIAVVDISRDMPKEYVFSPIGNASTDTYPLNVIPTDSLNTPIRSQGLYFESYQPFFVNMRHKSGSQGTSLTTKGQIGLGQKFFSGHIFTIYNTTSGADDWNNDRRSHFISVMATEDSTTVTIDMVKPPIHYIGHPSSDPITVTLDAFESYVVGVDHSQYVDSTINLANGSRITSDKPIAVNTGSWLAGNTSGQCIGSDQIVPADITGQEYILVRGLGDESTEHPMVVATTDGTEVYLNDESTPAAVLDEGEFYIVPTDKFTANDNLYVLASEKVYMYQTLSGSSTNIGPTVGLSFIPPLNCVGAKRVVLPFVNSLAGGNGQGRINIITKSGTSIYINESPTPISGAQTVTGNPDWVSYAFDPPTDNVIIESDSVMNVALLTRDNNVGTAGYFSGFTVEPVVGLSAGYPGTEPCVPGNAVLQVYGFDTYQWYFEGEPIPGATSSTLVPEFSGSYSVEGIDLACGFRFMSNEFVIPFCPSTLGITKQAEEIVETAAGSRIFDVTYRLFIENLAPGVSQNIQVLENIQNGLPVGATSEVVGSPTLIFGVMSGGINPNFDGINDKRLFPGNGSLPGLAADAVELTIRVNMNAAEQDGYLNQVVVTSKDSTVNNGEDGPFSAQDYSHDGPNPDPNGNGEPNEDGENDPTLVCFFSNDISYAAEEFCATSDPVIPTQDGVDSGLFTADIGGLAIDSLTGSIDPTSSEPGTYTVTLTTEGRCPTTTTTQVTIVEDLSSGSAPETVQACLDGDPFNPADFLLDEDTGGVWTFEDGQPLDGDFTPDEEGSYTLIYTIDNGVCGDKSTELDIVVSPAPNPGEPAEQLAVCVTTPSVDLNSFLNDADAGGVWTDQTGTVVSSIFSPQEPDTVTFTYTVSNQACGDQSTSIDLVVEDLADAGISTGPADVCPGDTVHLENLLIGQNPNGYWLNGDFEEQDDLYIADAAGLHEFWYVVDGKTCPADSANVRVVTADIDRPGTAPEEPVQACPDDPVISLFELLEGADPGGTWTRSDGGVMTNGLFQPNETGTFTFVYTLTHEDCGDYSTSLEIEVTQETCLSVEGLMIPEGFSPNGDGIGDYWIIRGLDAYPNNRVYIFNRWGNEILNASPYHNDWDGRAQQGLNAGEVLPVGTYWYILDLGDDSAPRKGFIYLNR